MREGLGGPRLRLGGLGLGAGGLGLCGRGLGLCPCLLLQLGLGIGDPARGLSHDGLSAHLDLRRRDVSDRRDFGLRLLLHALDDGARLVACGLSVIPGIGRLLQGVGDLRLGLRLLGLRLGLHLRGEGLCLCSTRLRGRGLRLGIGLRPGYLFLRLGYLDLGFRGFGQFIDKCGQGFK